MKTIYLDMDGVLSDFEGKIISLYGKFKKNKPERDDWINFIKNKNFEKLDMLPSAHVLLDFINKIDANIEILSSSGGQEFHDEVTKQKKIWLKNHNINYKANIVPGGHKKAEYANSNSLLIDDTARVIEHFKNKGGNVILHNHAKVSDTIEQIKKFID